MPADKCSFALYEYLRQNLAIVGGLQGSLNHDSGGEISANLNHLYDYMSTRLVIGNLRNDASILDEVTGLMVDIKMGWDGMPDTFKN